jgi:hypothetical protein
MKHERWLLIAMLTTVLLVGFAMFHDEQREFEVSAKSVRQR